MSTSYRAEFVRGGTSKALIFHVDDLPSDRGTWDDILLRAMGSPDPAGRQLDGMGGGVSSVSKVCIVGPPTREDAEVDYTFAQVQVGVPRVDWRSNCGNMASAIGPFAVRSGLVRVSDGTVTVRIHNTNTGKLIRSTFAVEAGVPVEEGELRIPGVAGTGAAVRLDFVAPGGASTGATLPAGTASSAMAVPGVGTITVSLIDVANACVFVAAADLGLTGRENPEALNAPHLLASFEAIRREAAVKLGLAREPGTPGSMLPFVVVVSAPQPFEALDGEPIGANDFDLAVRVISSGKPHLAVPITCAICTAAAARIPGSVPALATRASASRLRVGMPSGVIAVDADVSPAGDEVRSASIYRTTRLLFAGQVFA